ncbi:MAG TPA: DUF4402 domain-containing protein [Sphingomicrobium sp.]
MAQIPIGLASSRQAGRWEVKRALTLFQRTGHSVTNMTGRKSCLAALALVGVMGSVAPAWPQEVSAPCRLCEPGSAIKEEKPAKPVSLDVEASLDFGRLILAHDGGGSADLGPDGSRSVSGSVSSMGAHAIVGEVVVRGEAGRAVRVTLPASIELYGMRGGSIRLESIRSDLPSLPRLNGDGLLRFRFGGSVKVIGDVGGEYRGSVPVDVEYL